MTRSQRPRVSDQGVGWYYSLSPPFPAHGHKWASSAGDGHSAPFHWSPPFTKASGCGRLFHVRPAQLFEDTPTPALLLGLTLKPRCAPWAEWDHAAPAAKAEAVLLSALAGTAPVCSLHQASGLRASILEAVHLWPSQTHSGGLARGQNAPRSPPVPPPTASCLCFSL